MGSQLGSADKTGHFSAHRRADYSGTRRAPRRKLLALLILLAFPAIHSQPALAEAPKDNLPDLGQRPVSTGILRPSGNRVTLENTFDGKKFLLAPEYSNHNGLGVAAALASLVGDHAAVGILLHTGSGKKELLLNAGYQPDAGNRFILSVGQLRQFFDIVFVSGAEKSEMTQNSGGLSYQLYLGRELLNYLELNGYLADTPSRSLGDKTFTVDAATLFELWNDQRRIAGGRVTGLQGKIALTPLPGGIVKIGFGSERLSYDYLTGSQSTHRLTGSAEWQQKLGNGYAFSLSGNNGAAESRYALGLTHSAPTDSGGSRQLGIGLIAIRGRDGMRDDNQIKLSYTATFDGGKKTSASRPASGNAANIPAWPNLLDQVALRPLYLPMQAVARLDTTALPARLIAVDKTALPSGATLDTATGNVNAALPKPTAGIAGVTRNGAAFTNTGQFALVSGSLVVNPKLIEQPAVGVRDTYVVTLDNTGSGTTLVTVVVSHGSVKIDSITISDGDTTAPTTSAAPTVSGTTDTATTLSATLNEAGTGYYLVQSATAAAPSAATIIAANHSIAMTANTPATAAISGLTAATAYKIYFVAKDSAGNTQATVGSVAVTTSAAPDVTAPTTTVAPTVSGTTDTATTLSVTINEAGTGYYLVQPSAAAAPTVAAVQAGTSFAMTANVAATPAISGLTASTAYKIYFVAKDAANNVQAAISSVAVTTTAAPDITPPTTSAGPSVSGTTDTASTLSVTINENGTGYYLVQPSAAAAPTVAAVQAGTSFAMAANVAATPAISGLTASTAYKIYFVAKDAANNVQAAVSSVAVTTTAAPDITPPATSAGPSVSGTTDTTSTLSVTINENGTGYYLVQPAAAAAPTVAAVQAGTSFAMTANVAATPAISGLTASTAYKIYFVAKDAANNVQTAVSSVAVMTTAAPDITPPATSAGPSVSGTTDTASTLSVTINENGTGYYLVQAAVAATPSVATVQASGTAFAMSANVAATPAISGLTASTAYKIYFVAKDSANNVQAAVSSVAVTTTAAPDVTPPVTSSAPTISVAATDTTASVMQTINENGTGYYLVQAAAVAAPSVAAVKAGTSFAMTGGTPAMVNLSGLTASTAYKYYFVAKDSANNDQAAVSAGLAITTTAAPDITAPVAPTLTAITDGDASNGTGSSGYTNSTAVALAITDNASAGDVAGWFVSESSSAPLSGAGGWNAAKPTSYALSGGNASKDIYVYVKDAAGNVQASGAHGTIILDTTPPQTLTLISTAPDTQGTTTTGLQAQANENLNSSMIGQTGGTSKGGTYTVTGISGSTITFTYNSPTGLSGTPSARTDTISFNAIDLLTNAGTLSVQTSPLATPEVPPTMGDVPNQTYTSGSAITNLDVSSYVTTTNGDAVLGYTLTGTLPTGLSFNSGTGVLSGTPTETGSFSLSVVATDNDGNSNSDSFTVTINP